MLYSGNTEVFFQEGGKYKNFIKNTVSLKLIIKLILNKKI